MKETLGEQTRKGAAPVPKRDRESAHDARVRTEPTRKGLRADAARRGAKPDAVPGLLDIVGQGASVRRYRSWRHMRPMLPEILAAGVLQSAIYASYIFSAPRDDWGNLAIVCAVLIALPFLVAVALLGLRRQDYPITIAVFVTLVFFNSAVAVLSALRIPVSYMGLLTAYPVVTVAMIVANLRLRKALNDRVALLHFPGARQVRAMLGDDVTVIDSETADIGRYDRILIDSTTHHNPEWSRFLTRAYMIGADIVPWIGFYETRHGRVDIDAFDISHLAYSPSQIYYSKAKRALDLFAVIVTAPLTVPLGVLIWVYIKLLDGGPALFVQERRGYGSRPFDMLKFRTMRRGSNGGATRSNDGRIMKGCRLLRRFHLDELPQLINIWRGEMSLIGPRPVAEYVARESERVEPKFTHRSLVQPGITGWAQVTSGYAENTRQEIDKLSYDLYYIKHLSVDLDILIIISTVSAILFGRGAR